VGYITWRRSSGGSRIWHSVAALGERTDSPLKMRSLAISTWSTSWGLFCQILAEQWRQHGHQQRLPENFKINMFSLRIMDAGWVVGVMSVIVQPQTCNNIFE